jgi:uncharacterized protein (UPF0261 family)
MIALGQLFAERLNLARGPLLIAIPTQGLSIPNVPDGPFWDPPADAAFLATLKAEIQPGTQVIPFERHVNDPQFGQEVADLFINLMSKERSS